MNSTPLSEKWGTSSSRCARRPGVATITSGLVASALNCSSMLSPPTTPVMRRSVNLASPRRKRSVCSASSRVGDSTTPREPMRAECALRRSTSGIRNAAVLPLPVRAMATTSLPDSATGSALRWMGVGSL
jgi:hypothetical protein